MLEYDLKLKILGLKLRYDINDITLEEYQDKVEKYRVILNNINSTYIVNNINDFQKYGVFI